MNENKHRSEVPDLKYRLTVNFIIVGVMSVLYVPATIFFFMNSFEKEKRNIGDYVVEWVLSIYPLVVLISVIGSILFFKNRMKLSLISSQLPYAWFVLVIACFLVFY